MQQRVDRQRVRPISLGRIVDFWIELAVDEIRKKKIDAFVDRRNDVCIGEQRDAGRSSTPAAEQGTAAARAAVSAAARERAHGVGHTPAEAPVWRL